MKCMLAQLSVKEYQQFTSCYMKATMIQLSLKVAIFWDTGP
jgi:hypothetical protein